MNEVSNVLKALSAQIKMSRERLKTAMDHDFCTFSGSKFQA